MMTDKEIYVRALGRACFAETNLKELCDSLFNAVSVLAAEDRESLERSFMIRDNLDCVEEFIALVKEALYDRVQKESDE